MEYTIASQEQEKRYDTVRDQMTQEVFKLAKDKIYEASKQRPCAASFQGAMVGIGDALMVLAVTFAPDIDGAREILADLMEHVEVSLQANQEVMFAAKAQAIQSRVTGKPEVRH